MPPPSFVDGISYLSRPVDAARVSGLERSRNDVLQQGETEGKEDARRELETFAFVSGFSCERRKPVSARRERLEEQGPADNAFLCQFDVVGGDGLPLPETKFPFTDFSSPLRSAPRHATPRYSTPSRSSTCRGSHPRPLLPAWL